MSQDQPELQDSEREELRRRDQWWDRPLISLDTETTAADPLKARIIQVALLVIYPDGRIAPQSYRAIVNPGVPIPADATAVHGIDDLRVQREGRPIADVVYEILTRLDRWKGQAPIVIFNAIYDWPLLWEELGRTDICWTDPLADALLLDPLVIERQFNGVRQHNYKHKLSDVAARYNLSLEELHNADHDAVGAAQILRCQVQRYELLRKLSLVELQRRQRDWYENWKTELNAYWARKGKSTSFISGSWPFGDRRREL